MKKRATVLVFCRVIVLRLPNKERTRFLFTSILCPEEKSMKKEV